MATMVMRKYSSILRLYAQCLSYLVINLAVYKEFILRVEIQPLFHSKSNISPKSRSYHHAVCTFCYNIWVKLRPKLREAGNALVSVFFFFFVIWARS